MVKTTCNKGENRKRLDTDLCNIWHGRLAHTDFSLDPRDCLFCLVGGIPSILQLDLLLLRINLPRRWYSVTALSAVCLFYAAGNMFYSSVALRWDMAQQMVSAVHDWSTVKTVLSNQPLL
ncbi:hypothetical protein L1887_21609 [Cichorium endivia]|nr:hypothetical protein L1887_21609 [Cichorium endivia]